MKSNKEPIDDTDVIGWREYVIKESKPKGLEKGCLESFENYLLLSGDPRHAASDALYDWDL